MADADWDRFRDVLLDASLLLLDEASGELYMRASRNFQQDFVRTFRLPIQDTLAGSVLRTGNPVILDEKAPQKIKTAYLVHKQWNRDPRRMPGTDVIQMAVYHNARLASSFFDAPVGILAPGALADLIFVDYHPVTPLSAGNLPWHILFSFHESMVTTTIAAGKVLMRDRQLEGLDEAEIAAQARDLAKSVWSRYERRF